MSPPALDQHLRLAERGENFHIEQFVAQFGIEALIVPVLPRTARFDIERSHSDPAKPTSHGFGNKFRAVARQEAAGRRP